MFEKEAEEYVNEEYDLCYYPEDNLSTRINARRDWQKGAEFGYNKANEWHEIESKVTPKREISKQYMPKSKEKVLLKYHFSGDDEIHISDGYYDAYDFEFHIANNPKFRIVCVIAWKEIVLPELSKEIKEKCELCEDDPKWELAEKYHSYIAYKKDGTI